MSKNELNTLHQKGFTIGSLTCSNPWLNTIDKKHQAIEIDNSLRHLKTIKGDLKDWIFCYPYGAYNQDTLSILTEKNCAIALTTKPIKTDLSTQHKYKLSRFDTNDFPS